MTPALESPDDFLRRHGRQPRPHGQWLYFNCFGCGEGAKAGSCAMSQDAGGWKCQRATCPGVGPDRIREGSLGELRKALGEPFPNDRPKEAKVKIYGFTESQINRVAAAQMKPVSDNVPKFLTSTDTGESTLLKEASSYLHGRGFRDETIKKFGVRVCRWKFTDSKKQEHANEAALAFETFRDGKLVNIEYRFRNGGKKLWKNLRSPGTNHLLWGLENVPEDAKHLLITEGRFDLMAAWQMGGLGDAAVASMPQGIGNLHWIENDWERLDKFDRITLAVDMDAPKSQVDMLANRLGRHKCDRLEMPEKDLNACLLAGWTSENMELALQCVRTFEVEGLYHTFDFEQDIHTRMESRGKSKGLLGDATGLKYWDMVVGGNGPGKFTILGGYQGSGKTTLVADIARRMSRAGYRTLYLPLEEGPLGTLEWMIQQQLGREPVVAKESWDAMSMFGENMWWFSPRLTGQSKPEDLKEAIEYCVKRYGVRHIVLDNLTCVGRAAFDNEAQGEFARWFLYQILIPFGVHGILLMHARKPDGSGFKQKFPTQHDLLGSTTIAALAHSVIMWWRPDDEDRKDEDPDGIAAFEKCRGTGFKGRVNLTFDSRSRIYTESGTQTKSFLRFRAKHGANLQKGDNGNDGIGF